jgi:hypothetical protein
VFTHKFQFSQAQHFNPSQPSWQNHDDLSPAAAVFAEMGKNGRIDNHFPASGHQAEKNQILHLVIGAGLITIQKSTISRCML